MGSTGGRNSILSDKAKPHRFVNFNFLSLTDLSIFIFLVAGKEMDMDIPNNAGYLNIEDLSSLKQLQE